MLQCGLFVCFYFQYDEDGGFGCLGISSVSNLLGCVYSYSCELVLPDTLPQ
jgi:hypothetical protein